jgi:hypothetical protein
MNDFMESILLILCFIAYFLCHSTSPQSELVNLFLSLNVWYNSCQNHTAIHSIALCNVLSCSFSSWFLQHFFSYLFRSPHHHWHTVDIATAFCTNGILPMAKCVVFRTMEHLVLLDGVAAQMELAVKGIITALDQIVSSNMDQHAMQTLFLRGLILRRFPDHFLEIFHTVSRLRIA